MAYPVSYPMCNVGTFPGLRRPDNTAEQTLSRLTARTTNDNLTTVAQVRQHLNARLAVNDKLKGYTIEGDHDFPFKILWKHLPRHTN